MCLIALGVWLACVPGVFAEQQAVQNSTEKNEMTKEEAKRLGEEFGIVVEEVDEDTRKILKLQRLEGVAVFEVIGNSQADYAGIKVQSIIKEIDKVEVKNLIDFGNALKRAMPQCNFTVGTYETADPSDPVGWGVNFHFVGCKRD
jgi:C-terminal processing protease CtpA/Prc